MRRTVAIGILGAGLCAWQGGGEARAQEATVTSPTPTPTVTAAPPNRLQAEGALPAERPRATPAPTATPKPKRRPAHRRRARPEPAAPPPVLDLDVTAPPATVDGLGIPPFLLPIYKAAGVRYGVPWQVLAAINEIETSYGSNLNVSSAGAIGWMQFMPASWQQYGVDANADGISDPYDPQDAIFAAARYLRAAGADHDLRAAVFAYNHADWYVDAVLERARRIGGLSLEDAQAAEPPEVDAAPAAPQPPRRELTIRVRPGAAAVAVERGRVVAIGRDFVRVRDAAVITYVGLGSVAKTYPARRAAPDGVPPKRRLFAHPSRPRSRASGGARQLADMRPLPRLVDRPPLSRQDYVARRLTVGARIEAGTVLGRAAREPRPEARLADPLARSVAPEGG